MFFRQKNFNLEPDVVNVVNQSYKNAHTTLVHLDEMKKKHSTVHVSLEHIKSPNGDHQIVKLGGVFPITFKGATYNLPLHIRVTPEYPNGAPVVFLVPTADMAIVRSHKNVDQTGRCYFPYLSNWSPHASHLSGVIDVMTVAFSEIPPLYSKPKALPAQPPPNLEPVRPSVYTMPQQYQSHNNNLQPFQVQTQPYPPHPQVPQTQTSQHQIYQPQFQVPQQQQTPAFVPPNSSPFDPFAQIGSSSSSSSIPQIGSSSSSMPQIQSSSSSIPPISSSSGSIPTVKPVEKKEKKSVDQEEDDEVSKFCVVCFERPKEALIQPCNHICCCMQDANYMKNHKQGCPICRGNIENVIRVFIT